MAARGAPVQPGRDMRLARRPHGALAIGALSAEPARHRTFRLKPMTIRHDVIAAIGNTPLIRLRRASEETGCTILGKAEFMNPGQSVKDRAGRQMILEAEKRGELQPGGLVVEATAGNTGIGLAVVAQRARLPHADRDPGDAEPGEEGHAAPVRRRARRGAGGALREPEQLPARRAAHGRRAAQDAKPNGVLFADQWNNLDNRKAHYVSTGPEIWEETGGKVDGFVCAIGTGGTLAGVSSYLREKKRDIVIGRRRPARRRHVQPLHARRGEGVGGRLDHRRHRARARRRRSSPTSRSTRPTSSRTRRRCRSSSTSSSTRACCLGGSSGINVAGAIRLAQELGPGPHHRDGALRLRHALPVEAVQPGLPALEGPAGAGVARARERDEAGLGVDAGHPGRRRLSGAARRKIPALRFASAGMTSRVAPR